MGTDYPSNKEDRMAVIKTVSTITLGKIRGRRRLPAMWLGKRSRRRWFLNGGLNDGCDFPKQT